MKPKTKELKCLIELFHNFKLLNIEFNDSTLKFKILLPWENLFEPDKLNIDIEFYQVSFFDCEYYPIISDELIPVSTVKFRKDSVEAHTSDCILITNLKLIIENSRFNQPNECILWCKTNSNIEFAKIIFNMENFQITDLNKNKITLNEFVKMNNLWWEHVFESE
ncbi:MAG: hypothetical protein HYR91_05780 [Flavobacteriia bacterium]|nr:hypothetical protein [Flavobacteriia bacterium]